jgi:hypothetical protein
MTSQSVLITDTNIWIDLDNRGILVDVFHLPYDFLIPDFATRELIKPSWQTLRTLGLGSQELLPDQVIELAQLRPFYRNLSVTDLASFLLARSLGATLLTGDSRLYELANTNGLSVHGVLWLLDKIVLLRVLAPEHTSTALQKMLEAGARLPQDECRKRLSDWSR